MLDYRGDNVTNDDVKNVTYRSTNSPIQYCIMRIGAKYYTLKSVEALEYHMERKGQIQNVDRTKSYENRILIGDANIYANLENHIKGVQIRKDSSLMRDGILTSSPDFFKNLSKEDFEKWINLNTEWLQKTYNENCLYAVLHMDETTPHIHFTISPVYINSKGKRVMSDQHYFGGRKLMSDLQTNYSQHIQSTFKTLNRGLKGSRMRHIGIRQFYKLASKELDEKNMESILAKAKNNELTEIKLNDTKKTLTAYKNYQDARDKENEKLQLQCGQLYNNLRKVEKDNSLYIEGMKLISEYYHIPEKELVKILEHCKEKEYGNERE